MRTTTTTSVDVSVDRFELKLPRPCLIISVGNDEAFEPEGPQFIKQLSLLRHFVRENAADQDPFHVQRSCVFSSDRNGCVHALIQHPCFELTCVHATLCCQRLIPKPFEFSIR